MTRPRFSSRFLPTLAAFVVAAMTALYAAPADAQGTSDSFVGTISEARRSAGIPFVEVLPCEGQRRDDRVTVRCLVRYDDRIEVTGAQVIEQPSGREWVARRGIPLFTQLDPGQDDTAFFLLIDSGSKARRATVQSAASDLGQIFSMIGSQQRVAVANFAGELTLQQDFTNDGAAVVAALNRIQAQGAGKELYKHSIDAIGRLEAVNAGRRVLIIVSDGGTNDKGVALDQVLDAAKRARVRIVTVGYAERDQDTARLQVLERLTPSRRDQHRASVQTKALPDDFTKTILTRFGHRGMLEAESPTRDLPRSLDVSLRHPDNRTTTFKVALAAGQPGVQPPADMTPTTQDTSVLTTITTYFEQTYAQVISLVNDYPWYAAGIGGVVLAALIGIVVAIVMLRGRRPQAIEPIRDATPPPSRPLYESLNEPTATAQSPEPPPPSPPLAPDTAGDPVTKLERVGGAAQDSVTVFRAAPKPESEAPIIAWLEFNGKPGRFAVRKNYITIGRQTDNDAVTDPTDATVSRYHAVVSLNTDGRFKITNRSHETRSQPNPIFVNGEEQDHAELADGDMVKLGTGTYGFVFRETQGES